MNLKRCTRLEQLGVEENEMFGSKVQESFKPNLSLINKKSVE